MGAVRFWLFHGLRPPLPVFRDVLSSTPPAEGSLNMGLYNPSVSFPAQAGAGSQSHASEHSINSVSFLATRASSRRA